MLTADEVHRLMAAHDWEQLAFKVARHITAHPQILTQFSPEEQELLANVLLLMTRWNDAAVH